MTRTETNEPSALRMQHASPAADTQQLTADEEISLALLMAEGRRAADLLSAKPSPASVRELRRAVALGAAAREEFITRNYRLVGLVASDMRASRRITADNMQDGCLGLMRAVDRFDPTRGKRFASMAREWIRASITRRHAETIHTIRIPEYKSQDISRMHKTQNLLATELGRQPSQSEIAARMGLDDKSLQELRILDGQYPAEPKAGIDFHASGHCEPSSIRATCDDTECPHSLIERLREAGAALNDRQQQVLEMRFGLGDREPATCAAVGEALGISRQRVSKLEKTALKNLAASVSFDDFVAHQTATSCAIATK